MIERPSLERESDLARTGSYIDGSGKSPTYRYPLPLHLE
jgi:hypothetical protein